MFAHLRETWEKDIRLVETDEWVFPLLAHQQVAISSRYRLIQFKYLHIIYLTYEILWHMQQSSNPKCIYAKLRLEMSFTHYWPVRTLSHSGRGSLCCVSVSPWANNSS